ncbi:aromatic acid exporter family protein [Paenibacillus tarimensis]|uniref:aromatic acid exporter family protein n=1 Tax=Paenibacillus tarimensis TaxID=416012 RepID=UPI001F48D3A8|nr:aromatic acid exporter family protein [Paenibacillus tarimensis]MCF2942648.1 aromatic acid exporter family protein [Paenibacillus tarimensis]
MGIRVIKTALAAVAAIYTAQYFNLDPPLSAGLLAILGVEVTRMKGLHTVFARFTASVLGLLLGSAIFLMFGFEYWSASLFVLIVFPILAKLNLKDGIVTSSVIVFHVFAKEEVSVQILLNEVWLLLVGLGWATVINLIYMPREDRLLQQTKVRAEQLLAEIFQELGGTLRNPAHLWSGGQLLEMERAIEEGRRYADMSRENRFWYHPAYWTTYFEMRSQQFDMVQHMVEILASVYEKQPQGDLIADMLDHLSEDIKSDVYTGNAERELYELEERFRSMELPQTREEFEVRAALLQLCRELERYLAVAKRFKKKEAVKHTK